MEWLARAYAGAKGPATRFQWGYNYLVGMLELTPEDVQGIERAGLSVLGELDGAAARVIDTLRARTSEICRKLPAQDAGRANCEKFLTAKARPTQAA